MCVAAGCAHGADFALDAAADQSRYRTEEHFASGQLANQEQGELHGWRLSAEWSLGDQALRAQVRRLNGALAYGGRTQIGIPIGTSTDLTLQDASLAYRYTFIRWFTGDAGLGAAIGQRRIARSIAPTLWSTALDETLRWRYWRGQGYCAFRPSADWTAEVDAYVERGWRGALDVDFHGMGDATTVHPSNTTGYGAQARIARRIASAVHVGVFVQTQLQDYGASPYVPYSQGGVVIGQVRYPGSRQSETGAGVFLGAQW